MCHMSHFTQKKRSRLSHVTSVSESEPQRVERSHRFDQSLCVTRTPHFRFYQFCHWFWEMVSSLKVLFSIFYWSNLDFWKTQSIDFSLKSPKSLTFPGFDQFFIENSTSVSHLGVVVGSTTPLARHSRNEKRLPASSSSQQLGCGCGGILEATLRALFLFHVASLIYTSIFISFLPL